MESFFGRKYLLTQHNNKQVGSGPIILTAANQFSLGIKKSEKVV
jgi:hypothetical protein